MKTNSSYDSNGFAYTDDEFDYALGAHSNSLGYPFWDHTFGFKQIRIVGSKQVALKFAGSRAYTVIDYKGLSELMQKVKRSTDYQIYAETILYKTASECVLLIIAEKGVHMADAIRVSRLKTEEDSEYYLERCLRDSKQYKRSREKYDRDLPHFPKKRRKLDHEFEVVCPAEVKAAILQRFPEQVTCLIMMTLWDKVVAVS